MHYLDKHYDSPEMNLALDEALLEGCENAKVPSTLRFWESSSDFVVLGYSNKAKTEVLLGACGQSKVPILRRPSGGGTVVQGKGCLNYSLILKIVDYPQIKKLTDANQWIMTEQKKALESILKGKVTVQGCTDLTLNNLKFSGNAQRRKKEAVLFHGTFLYDFDLDKIEKYLATPSKQPEYRLNRKHLDFVKNISVTPNEIKSALKKRWKVNEVLADVPEEKAKELVEEKYSKQEWNFKF